jgi:hypothetical protein
MWLFTETGFISAVQHRDQGAYMVVRARDKESLEPLADMAGTKISFTPMADYPYRTIVSKLDLNDYMAITIDTCEYDNFKSRVAQTRGKKFVDVLHHVWSVMHGVEDKKAKNRFVDDNYTNDSVEDFEFPADFDWESLAHEEIRPS